MRPSPTSTAAALSPSAAISGAVTCAGGSAGPEAQEGTVPLALYPWRGWRQLARALAGERERLEGGSLSSLFSLFERERESRADLAEGLAEGVLPGVLRECVHQRPDLADGGISRPRTAPAPPRSTAARAELRRTAARARLQSPRTAPQLLLPHPAFVFYFSEAVHCSAKAHSDHHVSAPPRAESTAANERAAAALGDQGRQTFGAH